MNIEGKFLKDEELLPFLKKAGYSENTQEYNHLVEALLLQQEDCQNGWPRLIRNLNVIGNCPQERIRVEGVEVLVMLNPTRKQSLTSTTFEGNFAGGECFLCNLDEEQKGIGILNSRYIVLANPGVTFRGDLTIASVIHEKQLLSGHFSDMIEIARLLSNFSIFYNGAMSGASSPHFHFQGSYKDMLIGEQQITQLLSGKKASNLYLKNILTLSHLQVFSVENFLRKAILVSADSSESLLSFFEKFYGYLAEVDRGIKSFPHVPDFGCYIDSLGIRETEGRMNIMLRYEPAEKKFICVIFPKLTNRPSFYFSDEDRKIILGFAIKESLGVIITYRENDYKRLIENPPLIEKAYRDTTLPDNLFDRLVKKIKELQN